MDKELAIICPHCGKETIVHLEYTQESYYVGVLRFTYRNGKGTLTHLDYGDDYWECNAHEEYDQDPVPVKFKCFPCGYNMTKEEVIAGRNAYRAKEKNA